MGPGFCFIFTEIPVSIFPWIDFSKVKSIPYFGFLEGVNQYIMLDESPIFQRTSHLYIDFERVDRFHKIFLLWPNSRALLLRRHFRFRSFHEIFHHHHQVHLPLQCPSLDQIQRHLQKTSLRIPRIHLKIHY